MKGCIKQRSPGHFAIIIDALSQDGKRRRKWHSFKGTKREAQIRCAQLVAEAQRGGSIAPNKLNVEEYINRFESDWIAIHVSARSAERYRDALGHVRRYLGDRPLQKVQPAEIAGLYANLHRSGLAARSIRVVHVALHRALNQAKIWGLTHANPADLAKPPKVLNKEVPMLQPDQAAQLLDRLRGKPLYLLASLALATGMRRNEMLALRWQDIAFDAARLTVVQSLEQTVAHGIRTKTPKTGHGRRTIGLPPHIVAELRQHWREQQEGRLAMGLGKASDSAPVFAAPDGGHLSPNGTTLAWGRQMEALGMSGVLLHSLRHTHASMLIAAGVDILTISRRLGHSSPVITLNTYGHLIAGGDDRAAQVMAQAFGSNSVAGGGGKPAK